MRKVVGEFSARRKRKGGYKKLLNGENAVPTAEEYEKTVTKGKNTGTASLDSMI